MKKSALVIILFFISLALYFSFGFYHITQFETADEHYWIYDPTTGRIHDYWDAISSKNWLGTRINDKPGVMLAYISGVGILFEDNLHKRHIKPTDRQNAFSSSETEKINMAFRVPILIFNGLFSLFLLWAIKRLTKNKWLALTAMILILLNPIIIGISQIVNPDSLLWVFSFSSLISLLNYLKYREKKDAILCSVLLGFSLLSKYSAVIFIPFFFMLIIINLLQEKDQLSFAKKAKENMLAYFIILLGSFFVFATLMPAVILEPSFFYSGTIGFKGMAPIFWLITTLCLLISADAHFLKSKILFKISGWTNAIFPFIMKTVFFILSALFCLTLANWSIGDNILEIKGINFDAGHDYSFRRQDFFDKLFLEIYPLIFSLTPLVLLSIIALWIKGIFGKLKYPLLVFSTSTFLIVFYAAVLKQDLLVNIRYSVMLYPILMLVSAFSINEFIFKEKNGLSKFRIVLMIIGLSSLSLWLIKPYYFNYTNNLLPKNSIITGAWGYGGYEAAQFLNALPNSNNLKVWSDYWGFCYFFDGTCIQGSGYDSYMKKSTGDSAIDYYIMTRRGEMVNAKMWRMLRKNKDLVEEPVWSLSIDDRPKNFIRIYKAADNQSPDSLKKN
jgi:4-amino-4-deoxy-L-arabinose transferase-like glycosyltransferase